MDHIFDVAIVGGGINGCGCAADAALRGLSVVLLEQDDLASKTSSNSSKLIHGGLRYLEQGEFRLVRKALNERQKLLDLAPHLVHPQAFFLPYLKSMRPAWLLRLGLFFYDHLTNKNRLPPCQFIKKNKDHPNSYFAPLIEAIDRGVFFYDAATDDARLTITNALQAKNHGASIRPYSKVIHAEVIHNLWQLTIQPQEGAPYTLSAKSLINATGPWVECLAKLTPVPLAHSLTLVKGSHILVPKYYEGEQAYLLQHNDKRIIFVIPYQGFSLIGTTDFPFQGSLQDPIVISEEEIDYLLGLVNSYFTVKLTKEDLVFSWSGLRTLIKNQGKKLQSLSRDYHYELSTQPAPLITILGGKITTYRLLAEEVVNQLRVLFPQMPPSKTENTPLPGATFNNMNFEQYCLYATKKYSWLPKELLTRYLYSYGSQMEFFLSKCTSMDSMGLAFGSSLYQVELDYLITQEWAKHLDDVLERRTKLEWTMNETSKKMLRDYLKNSLARVNYA